MIPVVCPLVAAWLAVQTPPHLVREVWPGAVKTTPRPAPGSSGAPLATTVWLELESGTADDDIDPATVALSLVTDAEARPIELLRDGTFQGGATGFVRPLATGFFASGPLRLGIYAVPAAPLAPATCYHVVVSARSKQGLTLDHGAARFDFTTRGVPDVRVVELTGDLAAPVAMEQRVFSGLLKPSFDTSELAHQLPMYELLAALPGPPPRPAALSLQRDWPLCGDYWTNPFFDGDPNLVREQETRAVTAVTAAAGTLEVVVAPLPEAAFHTAHGGRPLVPDFPAGCEVLLVDDAESRPFEVVAVDEATQSLRLRPAFDVTAESTLPLEHRRSLANEWRLAPTADATPDAPATPGHFRHQITRLVKLRPHGTLALWFDRLDHEWDLVHGRFGRRLVVDFDRVPCDLSRSGVPGRVEPPKDPVEWHAFVRAVTDHLIQRYGATCFDFLWSVGNEPDLRPLFWSGTDEEFLAFYDVTVDAILRAFEERGLDSARVRVGGLELGALAPEPALLHRFLAHCSPLDQGDAAIELNAAFAEPRLLGSRSRRVEALAAANGGRGSPCDFISLHQYKHAAAAVAQLARAQQIAMAIDAPFFKALRVDAFESDPEWNPGDDPALHDLFLGNGYWPTWAADWTRRIVELAEQEPSFRGHEALLTVFPSESNFSGVPVLASTVTSRAADGALHESTIAKDIVGFLACTARLGTVLTPLRPTGRRDPVDSADPTDDATRAPITSGFCSVVGDEILVLLYGHDPLDLESRDARERPCRVTLRGSSLVADRAASLAVTELLAIDRDHGSPFRVVKPLLAAGPRAEFTDDELAQLLTPPSARLDPSGVVITRDAAHGNVTLELPVPSNGLRLVILSKKQP